MMLISSWAGKSCKSCSSSSQMWLTAAPGGVVGGDAVGVAAIWIRMPSSLRMWTSIAPFCGRFHETATAGAFGVASSVECLSWLADGLFN